jgi:hypothetical protein
VTVLVDRTATRARPAGAGASGARSSLEEAVLRTVAYADVFDFALGPGEVHRYLVGIGSTRREVDALFQEPAPAHGRLEVRGGLVTLADRGALVERRARRRDSSARAWPAARRYARLLASIPFVRMVAVTGALAAGNTDRGDDIDLMVVTARSRVWSARLGAVALARLARAVGDELCPNYFLAESALALPDRDLYAAMELALMVPLTGIGTYRRLRAQNGWVHEILPNAVGAPPAIRRLGPVAPHAGAFAERVLGSRLGGVVEAWERDRKVERLRARARELGADTAGEACFSADRCKGHLDGHRARIRAAYERRLRELGVEPMWGPERG